MDKKRFLTLLFPYSIFCLLSLMAVCWHHNVFRVTGELNYLGGPASGTYNPVEMMWWLVIFIPVWLGCGWVLDTFFVMENYRFTVTKALKSGGLMFFQK